MIWGFAFSSQSVGAEHMGPWTFLTLRAWLGVVTLLVFIGVRALVIKHTDEGRRAYTVRMAVEEALDKGKGRKLLFTAGASTGILLCLASALQQEGIAYTSVARSSFITGMYVVLVPIIFSIAGKRPGKKIWFAVMLSVAGLYLLSFPGSIDGINRGDLLTLGCALLFSFQIICINHFADRLDGLVLSCSQFFFEAVVATAGMLIFENPAMESILPAVTAILYAGIMSNGVAYTLQIIGQRGFDPTIASLCMCMESVFGALGGFLILGQTLTVREVSGCALMFAAILTAEVPMEKIIAGKSR